MIETVLRITNIRFGSFVKFFCLVGFAMGLAFSALGLVPVFVAVVGIVAAGEAVFPDILASFAPIAFFPVMTGLALGWFSVLAYLPFKLFMKIRKGVVLTMSVAEYQYIHPQRYNPPYPPEYPQMPPEGAAPPPDFGPPRP